MASLGADPRLKSRVLPARCPLAATLADAGRARQARAPSLLGMQPSLASWLRDGHNGAPGSGGLIPEDAGTLPNARVARSTEGTGIDGGPSSQHSPSSCVIFNPAQRTPELLASDRAQTSIEAIAAAAKVTKPSACLRFPGGKAQVAT